MQYWIWIFFLQEKDEKINILTVSFLFYLSKPKKKSGYLRWFAFSGWSSCWYSSLSSTGDTPLLRGWKLCVTLLCHTINATRETKTLLPFPSAVISPPFILPPLVSSPAIYNYDARGEEELSLQIGDTVHILEKYEGEIGLRRHDWTSVMSAPLLRHNCVQSHISCSHLRQGAPGWHMTILYILLVGSSLSLTDSLFYQTGSEVIGWGGNPKRWVACSCT